MGILRRLLGPQRPVISRDDIPDVHKVFRFIGWFMENEPFVTTLSNPSCNAIFAEGYRPYTSPVNDPELMGVEIVSLQQWFLLKVFLDLNLLKDADKGRFAEFIEILEADTLDRLQVLGAITSRYGLQLEHFIYEKEIAKITDANDLATFKAYYFHDAVIVAETRILAWVYHIFFGEWFKFKDSLQP